MTLNFYVEPLANNRLNSRIHWKNSGALVCVVPCKCVSFVPPGIGGCVCNNCYLGFVHHRHWGRRACANTTLRPQRHKCRSKQWVFRVCFLLVNATCFTSSFFGASESPQCTAFRKVLRHQDDGKSRKVDLSRQIPEGVFQKLKNRTSPHTSYHHILLGLTVDSTVPLTVVSTQIPATITTSRPKVHPHHLGLPNLEE